MIIVTDLQIIDITIVVLKFEQVQFTTQKFESHVPNPFSPKGRG